MSQNAANKGTASTASTLLPVLVLVSICVVAGVLLGVVHFFTEPVAEANAQEKANATYAMLVPEAASFEEVATADELAGIEGAVAALAAQDEAGSTLAYVIVAEGRGYGGPVPLAVAFGEDGTVRAITAMDNEETPGLGTKIAANGYLDQYVGRAAQPAVADDVDFISGATISSKAALAAFNRAVEVFEEVC